MGSPARNTDERGSTGNRKAGLPGLRESAPFLSLGIQLAVTVLVAFGIGSIVDWKFEIHPYGKVVGGLLGCLAALVNFIREAQRIGSSDQNDAHED